MFGLSYWFLPFFAGCTWFGTLLAMLIIWVVQGEPHYPWMAPNQRVTFISDVGATKWGYPLFIAGSTVTVVVFDLSFISERWLRHKGRLAHNYSRSEKVLSICAIIGAVVGACGLILLTIFNTRLYRHIHDAMIGVFIAGYIISAIFICAEYQRLGIHFREHRILRVSFWIKLAFIFVEVGLGVAFGVTQYKHNENVAGVLEWTISLVYILYVWSFIIDFLPAIHTKHKGDRFPPVRRADDEMAMNTQSAGTLTGGPVYSGGGYRHGDAESYGSQQPISQSTRHYQQEQYVAPSRNF